MAKPKTQTIEVPDDIAADVLTSPLIIALCRLRSGDLVREASEDLGRVVNAAGATGKKSALTLKLEAKPNGRGKILIIDDVATKLPRPDKGSTALFTSGTGQLVPFDPDQGELDFKVVELPPQKVKDA